VMVKLHKFPGPAWEILMKIGNQALTAKQKENRSTTI
jgi:ornithine--oxo-acid transaminase